MLAQPYTLHVNITGQPDNPVVIGKVNGDKFIPSDTLEATAPSLELFTGNRTGIKTPAAMVYKSVNYRFDDHATPSMYRIIFGHTTYAKVMGEPPQQLDFIFNNEDIILQTDFKNPPDSISIIKSEENSVWFEFLSAEKEYKAKIKELETEVDYYHSRYKSLEASPEKGDKDLIDKGLQRGESSKDEMTKEIRSEFIQGANRFNQIQIERDMYINQIVNENPHLLAARFIRTFREPFLDGYLNREDREKSYQREFLRYIDFNDEDLLNSALLSDKIFNYLVTFNRKEYTKEQREKAYIIAVDNLMQAIMNSGVSRPGLTVSANVAGRSSEGGEIYSAKVYEFLVNYLVHGFEVLKMDNVLTHIADNYSGPLCRSEDKTTLMRKLEAQKMKAGTVAPDFTMDDKDGNAVTLSHILKDQNLLIFWASWCPHCNEMMSLIKSWYTGNQKDGTEIIAISLDSSKSEWLGAVDVTGFEEFYNLSDMKGWDGKVAEAYNVYATPTMFIIDRNRTILAKPVTLREMTESWR